MSMTIAGKHCVLELYDCPEEYLNDQAFIEKLVGDAATHGMSTLLNQVTHAFEPHGVTSLALLAESHLSIHTWPEHGYAAVDVFTCGETANPVKCCEFIIETLQAVRHNLKVIDRGSEIPENSKQYV
jgi:S-adenosylmethionine decarboxylase